MPPYDPARRLARVLRAAIEDGDADARARDVLADAMSVSSEPSHLFLQAHSQLIRLPSEIRRVAQHRLNPEQSHTMLRHLPEIEEVFGRLQLENQWRSYSSRLKLDIHVHALEVISSVTESGMLDLDVAYADQLRDDVVSLQENVELGALPPEIEQLLHRMLSAIIDALDRFVVDGLAGLHDALASAAGEFSLQSRGNQDVIEKSRIGTRILGVLGGVALLIEIANGGAEVIDRFVPDVPWSCPADTAILPPPIRPPALAPAPRSGTTSSNSTEPSVKLNGPRS